MSVAAVAPLMTLIAPEMPVLTQPTTPTGASGNAGFSGLLSDGLQKVSDDALNAEKLSQDFALSDAVPVHQVTYALEQARLSLSLMVQVRNRLLDGYQQLMNMQL